MFSSSFTQKAWAPHSSLQERTQDQTSGCGSTMRKGKNFPIAQLKGCSFTKLQVCVAVYIPWRHTSGIWQLPSGHTECFGWHAEELTLPVCSLWRLGTWSGVLQSIALVSHFLFYKVWSVLDLGRGANIKTCKTRKIIRRHKEQRKKNQVYPEHKIHKEKLTAMKNWPVFIKWWNNAEMQACQLLRHRIQTSKLVIFRIILILVEI